MRSLDHSDTAIVRAHAQGERLLGEAYRSLGRPTESLGACHRAIELLELPGCMVVGIFCVVAMNFASAYTETAQSDKSMATLSRAKSMCLAAPNGATVYARELCLLTAEKANVLSASNRFEEAADTYREAISLMEHLKGANSELLAVLWGNLGMIFVNRRDVRGAIPPLQRATAMYERLGMQKLPGYAELL